MYYKKRRKKAITILFQLTLVLVIFLIGDLRSAPVEGVFLPEEKEIITTKGNSYDVLGSFLGKERELFVGNLKEIATRFPNELTIKNYNPREKGLYLVQMIGPVYPNWRRKLEENDVEVISYIPSYSYKVKMTPEIAKKVRKLYFVEEIGIYQPGLKLSGELFSQRVPLRGKKEREILVSFSDGRREVIDYENEEQIIRLANRGDVYYVSEYQEPELHDEMASQIIGGGLWVFDPSDDPDNPWRGHENEFDYGAHVNHLGWTGQGEKITIVDTGINKDHQDFQERVSGYYWGGAPDAWEDGDGHGSHVAGSAAGNTYEGTKVTINQFDDENIKEELGSYYAAQGLAYNSELYSLKVFDDDRVWVGPHNDFDLVEHVAQNTTSYIHSNSWGYTAGFGGYGESSKDFDEAVRDANRATEENEPMIIVVSAGNEGESGISRPATAKNVISVGSTENYLPNYTDNPNNISDFSSRGWTNDNRVKPDVVAPGEDVISAGPTGDTYTKMFGTSMSAPAVSGAVAVLVEWYKDTYFEAPSPAMAKAMLINTAYDLSGSGPIPNPHEGWGMVNLPALIDAPVDFIIEDEEFAIATGEEKKYKIEYIDDTEPLKISLVWTDKEAPAGSSYTLQNNLDLEISSPEGDIYIGNSFNDGWTRPNESAMSDFDNNEDGRDDVNNVENVYIHSENLESGVYTVKVIGNNIPEDGNNDGDQSQDYALVMYNAQMILPEINITAPLGGEEWIKEETKEISWEITAGSGDVTGVDLEYSVDNGASWSYITKKITDTETDFWNWTVPSEPTTEAQIKVTVYDDNGMSDDDTSNNFNIIGDPYIEISPVGSTVSAGEEKNYTGTEYNDRGEVVGDEDGWSWSIESGAGGSWEDNIYTSEKAGEWQVTATVTTTNGDMIDTTNLYVTPGNVNKVEINPSTEQNTISGGTIQFSAEAYDEHDNLITDNETDFTWSNANEEGLFQKTEVGSYEVTATYEEVTSSTVVVVVEIGETANVRIDPEEEQNIKKGEEIQFSAEAYDEHDNLITDNETDFTWSNANEEGLFQKTEVGSYEVTATYEEVTSSVTKVNVLEEYNLVIEIIGEGETSPKEGEHSYIDGEEVELTATPASDWEFDKWTGNLSSSEKSVAIVMEDDKNITANFKRKVVRSGGGGGGGGATASSPKESEKEEEIQEEEKEEKEKAPRRSSLEVERELENLRSRQKRVNNIKENLLSFLQIEKVKEVAEEILHSLIERAENLSERIKEEEEKLEEELQEVLEFERQKEKLISQKKRLETMMQTMLLLQEQAKDKEEIRDAIDKIIERIEQAKERNQRKIDEKIL